MIGEFDNPMINMMVIKYPERKTWESLCGRPSLDYAQPESSVQQVMMKVKEQGDRALYAFSKKFDGFAPKSFIVSKSEFAKAERQVDEQLKKAIDLARNNIGRFHAAQKEKERKVITASGVACWRKSVAIEKVGLYIPGGTAPLFSTLLMLGVPAKIAGCREIIVCTPPAKNGNIAPEILYAANLIGISKVYKIGGAQAIAAMTYGTKSIPKVDKIFGPGNQYVTMAKMLAQQQGVAIDMPAGPSEVLVIADKTSNPVFVAADLLSQAEHGPDSQVVLVSDNRKTIQSVLNEIQKQLKKLPRKKITQAALKNSKAILVHNLDEAISFSNTYAPEHLILSTENPAQLSQQVVNAGSVFLGHYSCESAGDYASGTNHTLPTNGYAKCYSGVSLDSFVKKITFQELTAGGIQSIGHAVELLAEAENLQAHKNAVSVRLEAIKNIPVSPLTEQRLNTLVREHIIHVKPYASARDEFSGTDKIFLDANENPFNTGYNRYPDPHQSALKEKISRLKHVSAENIFLGNGSDEAIDLIMRIFCYPGEDRIIVCPPTYGMYEVAAAIHDVEVQRIPLLPDFQPDLQNLLSAFRHPQVKLLFLCSPNNPTGNLIRKEAIKRLLTAFKGVVVLDEAYTDFAPGSSLLSELKHFSNLIILQTFSKAWGLAGIRLGMAFAHRDIIRLLDKIKQPYNISELTQQVALKQLEHEASKNETVSILNEQREILLKRLPAASGVLKVFPSEANFLLVRFKEPRKVYNYLLENGVVVRDRSSAADGCLRITIGTPAENQRLLELLNHLS